MMSLVGEDRINESYLMRLMADRQRAPVEQVETGRFDFDTAYALTAPFIVLPNYGTRCTTILIVDRQGRWHFTERRFGPGGERTGESRFVFVANDLSTNPA